MVLEMLNDGIKSKFMDLIKTLQIVCSKSESESTDEGFHTRRLHPMHFEALGALVETLSSIADYANECLMTPLRVSGVGEFLF
jgi:hypothetical protein